MNGKTAHRVVIVGAGFGGLNAAQTLAGASANITVIDRKNHHTFQPLLYQVATAGRKTGSSDLIEQRLEGVMILSINDGDVCGCAGQRLGCVQATEACSHDHDAMCRLAVHSLADHAPTL